MFEQMRKKPGRSNNIKEKILELFDDLTFLLQRVTIILGVVLINCYYTYVASRLFFKHEKKYYTTNIFTFASNVVKYRDQQIKKRERLKKLNNEEELEEEDINRIIMLDE